MGKTSDRKAGADQGSGLWNRKEGSNVLTISSLEPKSMVGCGKIKGESRMNSPFLDWATEWLTRAITIFCHV